MFYFSPNSLAADFMNIASYEDVVLNFKRKLHLEAISGACNYNHIEKQSL